MKEAKCNRAKGKCILDKIQGDAGTVEVRGYDLLVQLTPLSKDEISSDSACGLNQAIQGFPNADKATSAQYGCADCGPRRVRINYSATPQRPTR